MTDNNNYQEVFYKEYLLNRIIIVTTTPELIEYEINTGILNLIEVNRLSLAHKVDKIHLNLNRIFLFISH